MELPGYKKKGYMHLCGIIQNLTWGEGASMEQSQSHLSYKVFPGGFGRMLCLENCI